MSRRNGPKLDLKLNLSPPRVNYHQQQQHYMNQDPRMESPNRSLTASPPSSCVSSEQDDSLTDKTSPESATSMVLVGCPRCLMYVMLAEADPRCPKCKSTCLLDVIYETKSTRRMT